MSTSAAPAKRQKSAKDVPYNLIYWPGLPGRGEHVRLLLEEAGASYTDTAREKNGVKEVLAVIDDANRGDSANTAVCAPPVLRHGDLLISQTPNILQYAGVHTGLAGDLEADPDAVYRVSALAHTALDGLSNEVHDCHHPVGPGLYYEDQTAESLRKSTDYVRNRLPKFLGYFERVITGEASGDGPWLYGGRLTYADLVLFQCIDGVKYQFPKAIDKLEKSGEYDRVFKLYSAVKERPRIREYLASDRRQQYGNGIYRYYPELDVE